ncbi:MAG: NDP-sugar synthase [Methylovulum sp.]|nr:NDP-sugar synthase [Methylovulum sp.]
MEAIILADRKGQELLPLTDNTCIPLLPLAGKTVLEHTLEALVQAGLRQAHIVLSPYADEVKTYFGSGERWGMALSYSTSRGEEAPLHVLASLPKPPEPPFLLMRGDVVRSNVLGEFLLVAEKNSSPCLQAQLGGSNGFIMLCREPRPAAVANLSWAQTRQACAQIELAGAHVAALDSLAAFHQANLDAAAGRMALLLPGLQTALGMTQGRNTQAHPQNIKQGIALIGAYCNIHPSVELNGEVVIGDHVIIDRCAIIADSVIFPHSYVGEMVEVRNAIVRGNELIRVDSGAVLKITDTFLLADLTTNPIHHGLGAVYNRTMGLLLLAASLPLWVLAAVLVMLQKPATPFVRQHLRGNRIKLDDFGLPQRTEFTTWQIQVNVPILRFLPRLLAVINGDLRVIGALPVSVEASAQRMADWEKFADQAPAGLLGPTQLLIPTNAPEEEKLLSDSFYWANFSIRQDFRYLALALRSLFSRKCWWA